MEAMSTAQGEGYITSTKWWPILETKPWTTIFIIGEHQLFAFQVLLVVKPLL